MRTWNKINYEIRRHCRDLNANLHFSLISISFLLFILRLGGGRYSSKQQSTSSDHERNPRKDEMRSTSNKNLSHSQSQNSMSWRTHGSGGILKTERWVGGEAIKEYKVGYNLTWERSRRWNVILGSLFASTKVFFLLTENLYTGQTTSARALRIPC